MIFIVIPAFNEAATLGGIVRRALVVEKNVVVVDDGSTDQSSAEAERAGALVLRLDKNSGKAHALTTGMNYAREKGASAVLTLDGDGQHRPEDISRLIDAANHHPNNIIIGSRMGDKSTFPRKRYIANCVANFWISWASGYRIEDSQSGFRLYPACLLAKIDIKSSRERSFVFESEILIEAAKRGVKSIPVAIPALYAGTLMRPSHFRPVYDISQIVWMVAGKLLSRGMYLSGLFQSLKSNQDFKINS